MPKVTFKREQKVVDCEQGANLRRLAMANGVEIYPGMKKYLNCQGKSLCGECRVHVLSGKENLSPPTLLERFRIGVSWFKLGNEDRVRLSCQARVEGDVEVLTCPEFNWFGER